MCNFVKNKHTMLGNARLSSLSAALAECPSRHTAVMYRDACTPLWHSVSARFVAEMADRACLAMLSAGVGCGDRILILSDNMPEYVYVSLAAYKAGIVVVPVYAGTSAARLLEIAALTKPRLVFAGSREQYAMAAQLYGRCGSMVRIVTFGQEMPAGRHDSVTRSFADFTARHGKGRVRIAPPKPSDIADIIFTSGTMGEPKGVVITHAMYTAAFERNAGVIHVGKAWKVLEYLPYSHVFERAWSFFCLASGATLVLNRQPSHLQRALREIHPHAMCCVPHFWEKLQKAVADRISRQPEPVRREMERCLETGRKYNVEYAARQIVAPEQLQREYGECRKGFLQMLRSEAGLENICVVPTAGAVVSESVETFARSCGLPILVGYGLTETTATVSCDDFSRACTPGSVGRVIEGLQLKFGDNNEILLRGDTVTPGYYLNPEATEKAFADGWFRTGDAGYMKNGELYITGRIKLLMKTSNGKYVAPERVESTVNSAPHVMQTVVVAEQRKFVGALIVPVKRVAAGSGEERRMREIIGRELAECQAGIPPYSRIRRFVLIGEPLTVENGCLTSTLKIRRECVERRFAREIETIYDNKKYSIYDNL